jgi:hypothetical protein
MRIFPHHASGNFRIARAAKNRNNPQAMSKTYQDPDDPQRNALRQQIAEAGMTATELSKAIGRGKDYVRDYLAARKEDFSRSEWDSIRALLRSKTSAAAPEGQVAVVGYVGAGAAMQLYSEGQGPFDFVDAPDGSTDDTVAVEIRGESLGALFDQWLVYYDDVRDPPGASLVGHLCVVGLLDGRVLVKKLQRGQLPGHFNLLSNTEAPIYDVEVAWAAKVKNMTPR